MSRQQTREDNPAGMNHDLPSVHDLMDKSWKAAFLHEHKLAQAEQCNRIIKSGLPVNEVTDLAALLLSVALYGPPHYTKAQESWKGNRDSGQAKFWRSAQCLHQNRQDCG